MSTPTPRGSGGRGAPTSSDGIREVYAQIARTCFVLGLSVQDSDDLAQDVWEWMIRTGCVALAATTPWLAAVVKNFVMRRWRSRARQGFREGARLERACDPASSACLEDLELRLSFDRVQCRLPRLEANLLAMIRAGDSFAAAAKKLAIPHGSHDYYRKRLAAELTAAVLPATDRRLTLRPGARRARPVGLTPRGAIAVSGRGGGGNR